MVRVCEVKCWNFRFTNTVEAYFLYIKADHYTSLYCIKMPLPPHIKAKAKIIKHESTVLEASDFPPPDSHPDPRPPSQTLRRPVTDRDRPYLSEPRLLPVFLL